MARPSGIFKQDYAARAAWGDAYDAIPKSVFAFVAWHLANLASATPDADEAAERRFIEELQALRGHLAPGQSDRAVKAVLAALAA